MLQSWAHTFLHLLRISALFFFSFHPLLYLLNPVLLIFSGLSCSTTLSGRHMITRACQLSTVPGITDQLMEGARWAARTFSRHMNSVFLTVWGNRVYGKSLWKIGPRTKTQENWRPLNKYSNPPMDAMKYTGKCQGIWHRHRKIHVFLCYRK